MRDKLIGKKGKFGRCSVKGHGSECSVSQEIQNTPTPRSREKAETKKQIQNEIQQSEPHTP